MHLGESTLRITVPMYEKGRSFIMAGGFIKAYEGHKFVYLHLLCQGFENIGKAMLLANDYDKYGPLLKQYGHNLESILDEVKLIYGIDFLSKEASNELKIINKFYQQHQLRYGDSMDFSEIYLKLEANQLHKELADHLISLNQKFVSIEYDA